MKKVKACMPFYFETYLNNGFVLFFRPFWAVRKFLRSWSETEQLTGSDKKCFWLINLVLRVPSFYIGTIFALKNRVTTVHLL